MPEQLQREGSDLKALLAEVQAEFGGQAVIHGARKVRSGGVMGFYSKQRYVVQVEVPDEALGSSPDAAPAPAPLPEPTAGQHDDAAGQHDVATGGSGDTGGGDTALEALLARIAQVDAAEQAGTGSSAAAVGAPDVTSWRRQVRSMEGRAQEPAADPSAAQAAAPAPVATPAPAASSEPVGFAPAALPSVPRENLVPTVPTAPTSASPVDEDDALEVTPAQVPADAFAGLLARALDEQRATGGARPVAPSPDLPAVPVDAAPVADVPLDPTPVADAPADPEEPVVPWVPAAAVAPFLAAAATVPPAPTPHPEVETVPGAAADPTRQVDIGVTWASPDGQAPEVPVVAPVAAEVTGALPWARPDAVCPARAAAHADLSALVAQIHAAASGQQPTLSEDAPGPGPLAGSRRRTAPDALPAAPATGPAEPSPVLDALLKERPGRRRRPTGQLPSEPPVAAQVLARAAASPSRRRHDAPLAATSDEALAARETSAEQGRTDAVVAHVDLTTTGFRA